MYFLNLGALLYQGQYCYWWRNEWRVGSRVETAEDFPGATAAQSQHGWFTQARADTVRLASQVCSCGNNWRYEFVSQCVHVVVSETKSSSVQPSWLVCQSSRLQDGSNSLNATIIGKNNSLFTAQRVTRHRLKLRLSLSEIYLLMMWATWHNRRSWAGAHWKILRGVHSRVESAPWHIFIIRKTVRRMIVE